MADEKASVGSPAWERQWRTLHKKDLIKLCTRFFRRGPNKDLPRFTTMEGCIAELKDRRCFFTAPVVAWQLAGCHKEQILWDLKEMYLEGDPRLSLRKRSIQEIASPVAQHAAPSTTGGGFLPMDTSSPGQRGAKAKRRLRAKKKISSTGATGPSREEAIVPSRDGRIDSVATEADEPSREEASLPGRDGQSIHEHKRIPVGSGAEDGNRLDVNPTSNVGDGNDNGSGENGAGGGASRPSDGPGAGPGAGPGPGAGGAGAGGPPGGPPPGGPGRGFGGDDDSSSTYEDSEEVIPAGGRRARFSSQVDNVDAEESDSKLLARLQRLGFASTAQITLDEAKMEVVSQILPDDLSQLAVLKAKDRGRTFKGIPSFEDYLPDALKNDTTSLSSRLSYSQKEKVKLFHTLQKRLRDRMRWCLWQLYMSVDGAESLLGQDEEFQAWRIMLKLLADDFAFAIKEQQKIILSAHGYSEALLTNEPSIIPVEYKEKLKQIRDFDNAFNTIPSRNRFVRDDFRGRQRFSRFGNSQRRGGGSRQFSPSSRRHAWGQRRSKFGSRSPAARARSSFARDQDADDGRKSYAGRSGGGVGSTYPWMPKGRGSRGGLQPK